MTESQFIDLAHSAIRRVTQNVGLVGHLVCTQQNTKHEVIVREPEMRTAFQQECEERGLFYGVEVPTQCKYRFVPTEGSKRRSALVDFAILDAGSANTKRNVLLEFKAGQPLKRSLDDDIVKVDRPTIRKDIHKLWAEPVRSGRCMFHIVQAADAGTLDALEIAYNDVTQRAIDQASQTIARHPEIDRSEFQDAWSLLLLFVLRQRNVETAPCLYVGYWQGNKWGFEDKEVL